MAVEFIDIECCTEEDIKKNLSEILHTKTRDVEVRRELKMKKQKEALQWPMGL